MSNDVRWKPIDGAIDGYFISDHGSVRGPRKAFLKPSLVKGYEAVCVTLLNGMRKTKTVHRMVSIAFCDGYYEGAQTRHLDGNCRHNFYKNLAFGSALENSEDRAKHGNTAAGEQHKMAVLTEERIRIIRRMYEDGMRGSEIAKAMGMKRARVHEITSRKAWRHVA